MTSSLFLGPFMYLLIGLLLSDRMHGSVTFVAQNLEEGLVRLISTHICCIS